MPKSRPEPATTDAAPGVQTHPQSICLRCTRHDGGNCPLMARTLDENLQQPVPVVACSAFEPTPEES